MRFRIGHCCSTRRFETIHIFAQREYFSAHAQSCVRFTKCRDQIVQILGERGCEIHVFARDGVHEAKCFGMKRLSKGQKPDPRMQQVQKNMKTIIRIRRM